MIPETEQQWQAKRQAFRSHCRQLSDAEWRVVVTYAKDYLLKNDPASLLMILHDRASEMQRVCAAETGAADHMVVLCREMDVVLFDARKAEEIELEEGER